MANIDILELPVAIGIDGTEWIPLVQSGVDKRAQSSLFTGVQFNLDLISTTQGAVLYRNASDWVALDPGAGHANGGCSFQLHRVAAHHGRDGRSAGCQWRHQP